MIDLQWRKFRPPFLRSAYRLSLVQIQRRAMCLAGPARKGSTKAEERGVRMNLLRSAMLMMQQLQPTMLIPLKILTQANGLLGILNYATI